MAGRRNFFTRKIILLRNFTKVPEFVRSFHYNFKCRQHFLTIVTSERGAGVFEMLTTDMAAGTEQPRSLIVPSGSVMNHSSIKLGQSA
jgi:hypothetical protein